MVDPPVIKAASKPLRRGLVGAFPDCQSALMLVAARLGHIAGTKWGTKKYVDTGLLKLSGNALSTG